MKIIEHVKTESLLNGYGGIFPPFLQMVIATIHENYKSLSRFSEHEYLLLGEAKEIISGYLLNQLSYLGEHKEESIKILVALVSNYGTKTQKDLKSLSEETLIEEEKVGAILLRLIDLRLARAIDNFYEVTHDLLAKNILKNLMTEEELNIRKFKYLLESKTAAYQSTNSDLTIMEHLYLYKYRIKIKPSPDEIKVLIASSKKNNAPVLYWSRQDNIKHFSAEWHHLNNIIDVLYPYSDIAYSKPKFIIPESNNTVQDNIISLSKVQKADKVISLYDYCIQNFQLNQNAEQIRLNIDSKYLWQRLSAIIGLSLIGTKDDLNYLETLIREGNRKTSLLALKSAIAITKRIKNYSLLKKLLRGYELNLEINYLWNLVIEDFDSSFNQGLRLTFLFDLFDHEDYHPEKKRFILRLISKIAREDEYKEIKERVTKYFSPEQRFNPYYIELFNLSLTLNTDFKFFIDIIKETTQDLTFEYRTFMHEEIASKATNSDFESIKDYFINYENYKYSSHLNNYSNGYLLDWTMACAFSNLVTYDDYDLIVSLLRHKYWTVQNAAVRALERVCEESDLDKILDSYLSEGEKFKSYIKVIQILDRKFYQDKEFYKIDVSDDFYDLSLIEDLTSETKNVEFVIMPRHLERQ